MAGQRQLGHCSSGARTGQLSKGAGPGVPLRSQTQRHRQRRPRTRMHRGTLVERAVRLLGGGSIARRSTLLPGSEDAAMAMAADPSYPRTSIEDDFNYGSSVASASVHVRMAFLRKVYSILSVQVLLTTVTSAVFLYSSTIQTFVHERPALLLLSVLGSLGMILALTLYRHQHPVNLYLLFGFTFLEALTVAVAVSFYDVSIVLQAFILTTAVFLGLTAYTLQSKRDFSKFGAGLFACLWILILSGFLRLFFYSETMELVFAAGGALLFCGFIVYDTHLVMHKLSPEEYILASINLYLDIINLFLHLLRLLEAFNKK